MAQFELNVRVNGVEQVVSTIGGLEQALAATNQQLSQVEENSREFSFLTNQAQNLETVMTALSSDAQQFSNKLDGVNQSATKLNDTFTETITATEQLGNKDSIEKLNRNIDETVNNSQSLRTELRKITQELQNLEPGSARFQELSQRAGELRDQIGDTNAVVSALAGSTGERLGRALGSTVQIGVAGFQGLSAAAALFGLDAQALEPTLVKLTALLNLSQALETFGSLPDKISEISAGFSSLVNSVQGATDAAAANTAALGAESTAQNINNAATANAAIANSANAAANSADARSSLEDAAAKQLETVQTNRATEATNLNTVSTNASTVATTGWGLALKALPIIGIAVTLGTLAFQLYKYIQANDEAKKEEEKRKKVLEEQREAQKKLREEREASIRGTVQETVKMEQMLFQLKATTNGTKERSKLIKEINSTYGTTLKNLQDEAMFQKQLNDTIADYIAYQRVKVLQDINDAKFTKVVEEQQIALDKIKKLNISNYLKEQVELVALGKLKASDLDYTKDLILVSRDFSGMTEKKRQSLKNLVFGFDDYLGVIQQSNRSLEDLGGTSAALSQQVEEFRKALNLNTKSTKTQTTSVNELTAAEQFLIEISKERLKSQTDAELAASKATATLIDDIQSEKNIQIQSLNERLAAALQTDKDEVASKKKASSEKKQIEEAYNAYLKIINDDFQKRTEEQSKVEVDTRKKALDNLLFEYSILQKEIQFGDQDTLDTFTALAQRRLQLAIDLIDQELQNNNLSLEEFRTLQNGKAQLQAAYNEAQGKIDIQIAEANKKRDLVNYKTILEEKLNFTFAFNDREAQERVENFKIDEKESLKALGERLVKEGLLKDADIKKRDTETDAQFKERQERELKLYQANLELQAQAFLNLKKTQVNLEEQYSVQVTEINAKTNQAVAKSDEDTAKATFDIKIDLLNAYLDIATAALDQFSLDSLSGFTSILSSTLSAVQQFAQIQEQEFETSTERVAAYAGVISGLFNSVISGLVEQNQASLDAELESYRITKEEEQRILTEQLNAGLITRASYDADVEKLDKDLYNKSQKAKKDAFEQDKKLRIAQATISGLQGAVAAFAGAMQLGPIAGPIVGALLAAAVATLTGVQISQIQKQKWDGGPGRIDNIPSTDATANAAQQITQSSAGGFTSFNDNLTGNPQFTGFSGGGQSTGGMQKVYVVESDITSAQNRVRVLESNASFG